MEKVSLVACKDYVYDDVKAGLATTLKNLGGLEAYIEPGEKVLLKVNLLMKKKPEEATTTHPVFVKALAEIIAEYGCTVIVGDSPGGPFNEKAMENIYKGCFYSDIENGVNIHLNRNYKTKEVTSDQTKILKKLTVTDMLTDVDKVISVSKLKTHGMMVFTGAVKNMFGTIPGIIKAEYHFKMPDAKDFSDMLVDVCLNATPVLSLMDGIVGMEGAGPSAGEPRQVGVIIGSTSPYHLDVVATKVIGLEKNLVPTIERTIERGITQQSEDDIKLVGEALGKFVINDFVIPNRRVVSFYNNKVPKFLTNILDSFMKPKPVFVHKDCIGCGECARVCPADAIDMVDRLPIVRLDKCIRCFCCQELCPEKTVFIHQSWVLNRLRRL